MTNIFRRAFPRPPERPVVPPGTYHSMAAEQTPPPRRLHLRVEPDGRGLLIVNAATVLHLNETATAHAWHLVQGHSEDEAADWMARRFRITRGRATRDGRLIRDQVEALALGEDLDPVMVMGLERADPDTQRPTAPYRLDLALTYRMADGTIDPQARGLVERELKPDEWKSVLDQAWSIGIPHVVFTGGEPTLRPDLVDLIRHAETLGQVSGVVTGGEGLLDRKRLDGLAAAGLDHVLVVIEPRKPKTLEGLRAAVASDIFSVAHWTLDPASAATIVPDLQLVRATGATHLSVSAPPGPAAQAALDKVQQAMADAGMTLVWDLPAPFSSQNPVRLESGASPESGAWLYIQPDGDVLPTLGAETILGNVLRDPILDLWRSGGQGLPLPAA